MFDIGGWEVLVIAVATIIVVGPKELPKMLRTVGQFSAKMKTMAREFQHHIETAAQETGMDEVQNSISDIKNFSVTRQVTDVTQPISDAFANTQKENTQKNTQKQKIQTSSPQKENIKDNKKISTIKKVKKNKKSTSAKNTSVKKQPGVGEKEKKSNRKNKI